MASHGIRDKVAIVGMGCMIGVNVCIIADAAPFGPIGSTFALACWRFVLEGAVTGYTWLEPAAAGDCTLGDDDAGAGWTGRRGGGMLDCPAACRYFVLGERVDCTGDF